MPLRNLATTFRKQPKWLRISSYLIIAYFIYALMLGVITPLVLQSQLPDILSDKLGRVVSIEKVRINPFLLRVRVSKFVIEEEKSSETFVSVSLFEVDAGFWRTLTHFTPSIEHVSIIQPYTHLVRTSSGENTQFNFSDIINSLATSSPQQTQLNEDEETDIPHIRLGRFLLSGGHVQLSDNVTSTTIAYPELVFELTQLDTLATIVEVPSQQKTQKDENHYRFQLLTTEGGKVQFNGHFQLAPLELKGKVALTNIALAPLWPLSNDLLEAKLTQGLLDFNLDYHLSDNNDSIRVQADNTRLSLSNLTISDSSQPRIRLAGLSINGLKLDTKTQQVDIRDISIDEPWIDARFDENGLDLQAMLTPKSEAQSASQVSPQSAQAAPSSAQTQSSANSSDSAPPWRVILQSFALNKGLIEVHESAITEGVHWQVFDLSAATGVVDTHFTSPIEYTLNLGLASDVTQRPTSASGKLTSAGKVNVNGQKVSGSFDFSQFSLAQLQSYIKPYVNVSLQEGVAGVSGTFDAGTDSPITFNGQADINNLAVIDGVKKQPLLKWQDMRVTGIQYDSQANTFSLQKVVFDQPYAKLVIDTNGRTNISDIVQPNASANVPTETNALTATRAPSETISTTQENAIDPQPASISMAIRIDEISLLDGSAYFEDNSLRPRFASGIESLNGNITSLSSSADTTANVDINGKINGYAPVVLKGAINPLIDDMYLDLNFSVSGAELTSINPYSGTYMGYFIDKGLLSLDVKYSLENNQLKGENHVVIDQLTLGKKTDSDKALSLPIGLAIALLQDSKGVIDLGMEVSGDLNNPSFGFGSIILKTLGNIITKAVTAPFSLLANLVGSDDELNEIPFAYGSAQLNDATTQTLMNLAEALAKRPSLRVNIEGSVNDVSDAYELAEHKLQSQLLELSGLASLPADFSASTISLNGPIANALTTLFTTSTNKLVDEERQLVKAQLQQGDTEKVIEDDTLNQALYIAMYNLIRNAINIPKHELTKLAENRAVVVKTFLISNGNVDANRLFLLNSRHHLQDDKSGVSLTLEAN